MTDEREQLENLRAKRLLLRLPTHAPGAGQRVRARLVRGGRPAEHLRLGLLSGMLVLAAALLVMSLLHTPEGPPAPDQAQLAAAAPVDATLSSQDGFGTDTSIDGVELSFDGTGHIEGTAKAPRIHWETGTLHVEVTPDRGIQLAVVTHDAEVKVIGTGFSVTRDALGTRVEVRHGVVQVVCGSEQAIRLHAGDVRVCLPTTAGGLRGRALQQERDGAPATEQLATLERGLAVVGTQESIRDELAANRVRVLVDLGRRADALAGAQEFLATSKSVTRRAEVERVAVAAARAEGGCATAAPWLLAQASTRAGCLAR